MSATALILAAGEGTRMKSETPKVAHRVLGVPMVRLVVEAARSAGCERIVTVTGHRAEAVEALIEDVSCVRQDRQLGTGHAVMCAREALSPACGVAPGPLRRHAAHDAPRRSPALPRCASPAARRSRCSPRTVPDPTGYGSIVRDRDGEVAAIVEEKDCTPEQRRVTEVNTGTYCFDAERALRAPRPPHDRERPGRVLPHGHDRRSSRRRG